MDDEKADAWICLVDTLKDRMACLPASLAFDPVQIRLKDVVEQGG